MFVVDGDVKIVEYNAAAGDFLKNDSSRILRRRGGEVLHCIHAKESPGGCGKVTHCKTCLIRNSVTTSIQGNTIHRVKAEMELEHEGSVTQMQLLVTTTPLPFPDRSLVLLILENVTELQTLRGLLPVCAHCKKIRDDKQYWHEIDTYLTEHMDLNFSHGICPGCIKKFFDDLDAQESNSS